MYRNLRPAALNMSLVPGLHLSTSKSRCLLTSSKGAKPRPPELEHCGVTGHRIGSMSSSSTSADGESLRAFSPPDGSMCELLGADQDEASDSVVVEPCEPTVMDQCGPPLPCSSVVVRSSVGAPALGTAVPCEAGAVDDSEPPSPFGSILVRTVRQPATQPERRRGWAAEAQAVEVYEVGAAGHREPDSPFDSMLLSAQRQNAFTRSVLRPAAA
ncbi:unnamed protein product [Prorocentrum cordatum]|uniref:Uncharacterized protein n=1 Tax=Prorocentrum cordatum TaxID=2364126 RepID=A0ABN9SYS5_9DINO|nr:unnamed protein product [Polarella glacialis]